MLNDCQTTGQIHQIFVTEGFCLPLQLPPVIEMNVATLRAIYPDAAYRLWDGNSLRDMIKANFEPAVIEAFDLLQPFAYKCDVARLCLLYVYGGLYADLAMRFISPIRPPDGIGLVAFKALRFLSPRWTAMSNGIIWAKPGRREMRLGLNFIIENCRNRYYGANPLYPTGPAMFGHAVAAAMAEQSPSDILDDQWIGEIRRVVPEDGEGRICCVTPDNSLIAISMKPRGGDLTQFGAVDTNNYNEFWHRRQVYGERQAVWRFDNPDIRRDGRVERTNTGITIPSGFHGIAIYGPYIEINPGHYRVTVSFSPGSTASEVLISVTARTGAELVHQHRQRLLETSDFREAEFTFQASRQLWETEFTLRFFGDFSGEFRQIAMERIDPS